MVLTSVDSGRMGLNIPYLWVVVTLLGNPPAVLIAPLRG
jgi:hypothetical protein